VFIIRAGAGLASGRASRSVAAQVERGDRSLSYADFLTWRGVLDREPPRRPDPAPVYAPPAHRRVGWKFGFVASRCAECGTRQLPPNRVCWHCHAVDQMTDEPMSTVAGTVATYTIDRLAFTPSPPMVIVVVDFDGGGRFRFQLTDCDPASVQIGDRVEPTFRKVLTASGIHNYFWKVRPIWSASQDKELGNGE
jgi:uncharacterized OB-fold protein